MLYISKVDYNRETVNISDTHSRLVVYANITFRELKFMLGHTKIYGAEIINDKYFVLNTFDVCDVLEYEDAIEMVRQDSLNMMLDTDTEYITVIVKSDNIKDISSVIYSVRNGVDCYVTNSGYSNDIKEAKLFSYREAYTQAKYMTKMSKKKGNNILWRVREK